MPIDKGKPMTTRRVESFLLRIAVAEGQAQSPERWRGRIQHIPSGVELQIDALDDAVAFIISHLSGVCEVTVDVAEVVVTPPTA